MLDKAMIEMMAQGIWDTCYMTLVSTFFGYVIGLPLGIALTLTDENGITPNRAVYRVLDIIINVTRSVPFLILLIAFAFFYIAISFNPVEVANNIKNNGGAIPGIRSGRPTVEFIKKVLNRITLVGALLVAVIACFPMAVNNIATMFNSTSFTALAFGGSSMMIVVGVALETVRELEAQMSLRNYKGFLD